MRPILYTDRLALRPIELSDATQLALVYKDKALSRMAGSIPHPFYPLAAEFRIMKMRAGQARGISHNYALTLRSDLIAPADAPLMGDISLFKNAEGDWEIGYGLDRALWGQGLATEGAAAVLTEADRALGAPIIKAGHYDDNLASGRVLGKLGFQSLQQSEMAYSMARLTKAPCLQYSRPSHPLPDGTALNSARAS